MREPDFFLYHTLGCHLCEQAESLLLALSLAYEKVDIADDNALLEAFAVHIPVLKDRQSQHLLYWPFDIQELAAFARV